MTKIYRNKNGIRGIFVTAAVVVLAVLVIFCILYVADSLTRAQNEETLEAAQNAIMKSAVQCYALEGQYPTGLEYLEKNYGLTLDRGKYVYHYESVGANMVPDVKVYPLY